MEFYPRGLEIFGHRFVTVVPRIIAKEVNPIFCRVGVLKFLEKTHCRLRIEHFIHKQPEELGIWPGGPSKF